MIAAVLFRLALLTMGLAVVEIGLSGALAGWSVGWAMVLLVGLPLIVGGTAWFMAPLLGRAPQRKSQ